MVLLVQLPNVAGVRRPAAAAVHRSCRAGRFTVYAAASGGRVKEEEEAKGLGQKEKILIRVSDPVRERRLPPPLFSAPDEPSVPPPDPEEGRRQGVEDGEKDKGQYYVNMGDAIRTLREDLPVAFYREPNFHVYRFVRFFLFSIFSVTSSFLQRQSLLIVVNGRLVDSVFVQLAAGNLFSLIPSTSFR